MKKTIILVPLAIAILVGACLLYLRHHSDEATASLLIESGVPLYDPHASSAAFKTGSSSRDIAPMMPAPPAAFAWAYAVPPPGDDEADKTLYTAKGADPAMKRTLAQADNPFGPPDWFPGEHAPLPPVVASGRRPHVMACALCHLPGGNGHPGTASISGLSVAYMMGQFRAFRDGDRKSSRAPAMIAAALDITDAELRDAARYYAAIPRDRQQWIRVVETARVPSTHLGEGGVRFSDNDGKTVPLPADRIYEVAETNDVALGSDHAGFVDYVPLGALDKGRIVAQGANDRRLGCSACHGADYRGGGDAPRLAGRSASYLIRQLADMKAGARKGPALDKMREVIGTLSDADIFNVSAYLASRAP